MNLGRGGVGDRHKSHEEVGFSTGLQEGGSVWGEAARFGSENLSLLYSPAIWSLQEEQGEWGLDVGEDGREEGRLVAATWAGEPKSSLTILSLIRLNKDFTWEGRAGGALFASGSVLPSASGSGRQHSHPAVRSDL